MNASFDTKKPGIRDMKVAIIGLGLIGGSLARALKERLWVKEIIAVNRSSESLKQAMEDGVVDKGFTEVSRDVLDADIIFLCTPVKKTMEYLDLLKDSLKPGCILTDVGSTKAEIVSYAESLPGVADFIGGHPMAGTEKTGYAAGFSHLFENAYYVLTPSRHCPEEALCLMIELVEGIGSIPVVMDPGQHDRVTASISHVPHLIASALVNMVKELDGDSGKMHTLAAGGFKDITRIASASPEMWENIILSNKARVSEILGCYIDLLKAYQGYVDEGNSEEINKIFRESKAFRDTFPDNRRGLLKPFSDILVDVLDKPGMIGSIATLLGDHGINIKNLNVSNSREFEQGCLTLTLPDAESAERAMALLSEKGYKAFRR